MSKYNCRVGLKYTLVNGQACPLNHDPKYDVYCDPMYTNARIIELEQELASVLKAFDHFVRNKDDYEVTVTTNED